MTVDSTMKGLRPYLSLAAPSMGLAKKLTTELDKKELHDCHKAASPCASTHAVGAVLCCKSITITITIMHKRVGVMSVSTRVSLLAYRCKDKR